MKNETKFSLSDLKTTPKVIHVSLCIAKDSLNPDDVTTLVGLIPTSSRKKGDMLPVFNTPSELGDWRFSSKHNVNSLNLDEHLGWLFSQLKGRDEVLLSLKAQGYRRFVSCYWLTNTENSYPRLRFEFMRRFADLELDFYFDIYHEDTLDE